MGVKPRSRSYKADEARPHIRIRPPHCADANVFKDRVQ